MKSSQIWFIKVRNSLEKKLYGAVATRVIKNRVKMGMYPQEFLEYLKIPRVRPRVKKPQIRLFAESVRATAIRLGTSEATVLRSRTKIYNGRYYEKHRRDN